MLWEDSTWNHNHARCCPCNPVDHQHLRVRACVCACVCVPARPPAHTHVQMWISKTLQHITILVMIHYALWSADASKYVSILCRVCAAMLPTWNTCHSLWIRNERLFERIRTLALAQLPQCLQHSNTQLLFCLPSIACVQNLWNGISDFHFKSDVDHSAITDVSINLRL